MAVETTMDDGAALARVGSACTIAVADLALSAPTQLDEAMAGTSVYCHDPDPGASVHVTTEAAMEQLPLMEAPVPDPTR
jgi:hypothetical protein